MILFRKYKDLTFYLEKQRKSRKKIGFVPTMGALHEGHFSLLAQSLKETNVTVCSIFVNPLQFNNEADFRNYPNTIPTDILKLIEQKAEVLFLHDFKEVYPDEASKSKHFNLGQLESILEGKFRPGHFQGVCLVVEKLINMVLPDAVYFGQKDYQQCMVVSKLLQIMQSDVELKICPTLRESNGLAMSSRNMRLNEPEKEIASALYRELSWINENSYPGNFAQLQQEAIARLTVSGIRVEYLELANAYNLELTGVFDAEKDQVLLVAAYVNEIRLIDNLLVRKK